MNEIIVGAFTLLGALLAVCGGFVQNWYNNRNQEKRLSFELQESQRIYLRGRKESAYLNLIHEMRNASVRNDPLSFLKSWETNDDIMELFASSEVIAAVNEFSEISESIVRCKEKGTNYGGLLDDLAASYRRARDLIKADLEIR